jgi:hypothetical protein
VSRGRGQGYRADSVWSRSELKAFKKSPKFVDDFEVVLLIPKALTPLFRPKNFYFFLFLFPPLLRDFQSGLPRKEAFRGSSQ